MEDYSKVQPPDFSTGWKLKYRQSLFLKLETAPTQLVLVPAKAIHQTRKNWIYYMYTYFDNAGLAQGREVDYFGRGVIVKLWGLRTANKNEKYELFSILNNGKWMTFPASEYGRTSNLYGQKSKSVTRIEIVVYRMVGDHKEYLFSVKVAR